MATSVQENLVSSNAEYVKSFKDGDLALPPSKKYAVVTCMDARIDPAAAFGIPLGSAHIIRNAGGSAHEALRSVIISQTLLGTNEVLLIKHTGCGMLTFKNEDARAAVKKARGEEAGKAVQELDFLPFGNLETATAEEVQWLERQKAVHGKVSGWIYEVETGKVRKVQ